MNSVIIFAALIGLSHQTNPTHPPHTTHAAHTTHEPMEYEIIRFYYDSMTHQMIVRRNADCNVFRLSNQERIDVHTDDGMRNLEAKLLPMIDSTGKHEIQMSTLEQHIQQICGKGILHYYTIGL